MGVFKAPQLCLWASILGMSFFSRVSPFLITTKRGLVDHHNRLPVDCRSFLYDPALSWSKGCFGTHHTSWSRPNSNQELHHDLLPHLTRGIFMSSLWGLDPFHGVYHCQQISRLQGIPKEGRDFPSSPYSYWEAGVDFAVWRWTKRVGSVGQVGLEESGLILGNPR